MWYNQNKQGYVLLLTLLIVGAVGLVVTISFLLIGVGNTKTSFSLEQANQARALANACAEDALQTLHDNTSFSGYGALSSSIGTCSYEVSDDGGNKNIVASSTVGQVIRKVEVIVDQVTPEINVSSWQEIQ